MDGFGGLEEDGEEIGSGSICAFKHWVELWRLQGSNIWRFGGWESWGEPFDAER